jgi:molecular chaperone GrpE
MSTKNTTLQKKKKFEKKPDRIEKNIKKLQDEIKKLKQEIKEKDDKILRNYADMQNYQKRIDKELQYIEINTKKKYIAELIEINELLIKAYNDNNPKDGLKLIINNLEKFFEKEQIKYIECIGKTFDHNIHHAVTTVEKKNCDDGTIIEEVKKGYIMNEKLLRPSQVIVAKNKENKKGE